jgi:hypothetical protein
MSFSQYFWQPARRGSISRSESVSSLFGEQSEDLDDLFSGNAMGSPKIAASQSHGKKASNQPPAVETCQNFFDRIIKLCDFHQVDSLSSLGLSNGDASQRMHEKPNLCSLTQL